MEKKHYMMPRIEVVNVFTSECMQMTSPSETPAQMGGGGAPERKGLWL